MLFKAFLVRVVSPFIGQSNRLLAVCENMLTFLGIELEVKWKKCFVENCGISPNNLSDEKKVEFGQEKNAGS